MAALLKKTGNGPWLTIGIALLLAGSSMGSIGVPFSAQGETNEASRVDPGALEAIDLARLVIAHQKAQLDPQSLRHLESQLGQQLSNLETTQRLLEIEAHGYESNLHQAVALAKEGTNWQTATVGFDLGEPVPLEGYAKPSMALLELAGRYHVEPDASQLQEIRELDERPEAIALALARFVDAFLALDTAARFTYQDADPAVLTAFDRQYTQTLQDRRGLDQMLDLPAPGEVLEQAGIDLSLMFATRNQFLEAIQALNDVLEPASVPQTDSCAPVQLSPVFTIDLMDCDGVYGAAYVLSLDAGGNDKYYNNAGGNSLDPRGCATIRSPAAALIDLGGESDLYGNPSDPKPCGITGGGHAGIGFLFDGGGDDIYTADNRATNGGGYLGGAGFLLDVGGNDFYQAAQSGTNGGGDLGGIGFLLDAGGNDSYHAAHRGTNGGAVDAAAGILLDMDGDDQFIAARGGTNGGSDIGRGFLFSGGGNDFIEAEYAGTNGGGIFGGAGYLFNAGGNNSYYAGDLGTNGGGVFFGGVGLLVDVMGDDRYEAEGCGVNGGGMDDFSSCAGVIMQGLGLLVDAGGEDEFLDETVGHCWDCSMVPKGTLGMQVDSEDPVPLDSASDPIEEVTLMGDDVGSMPMSGPSSCRLGPDNPDQCTTGTHTWNEFLDHGFQPAGGLFVGVATSELEWHGGARTSTCTLVVVVPVCLGTGPFPPPGVEFEHNCWTQEHTDGWIDCVVYHE